MKQYTITEHNDNEGETFGYILMLTNNQYKSISNRIDYLSDYDKLSEEGLWGDIGIEDNRLEIEPTSYIKLDVYRINKRNNNSYMDRLGYYQLSEYFNIDNFSYEEDLYKAVNLERVKAEDVDKLFYKN